MSRKCCVTNNDKISVADKYEYFLAQFVSQTGVALASGSGGSAPRVSHPPRDPGPGGTYSSPYGARSKGRQMEAHDAS